MTLTHRPTELTFECSLDNIEVQNILQFHCTFDFYLTYLYNCCIHCNEIYSHSAKVWFDDENPKIVCLLLNGCSAFTGLEREPEFYKFYLVVKNQDEMIGKLLRLIIDMNTEYNETLRQCNVYEKQMFILHNQLVEQTIEIEKNIQ